VLGATCQSARSRRPQCVCRLVTAPVGPTAPQRLPMHLSAELLAGTLPPAHPGDDGSRNDGYYYRGPRQSLVQLAR
jgi:hypothetical protein